MVFKKITDRDLTTTPKKGGIKDGPKMVLSGDGDDLIKVKTGI